MWLGHSAPQLGSLTVATPKRLGSVPAVSNLLGGTEGASLAQRLGASSLAFTMLRLLACLRLNAPAAPALKLGRPVVVSSNLPSDSPLLLARRCASCCVSLLCSLTRRWRQAVAEKYLINLLHAELPA